MLTDLEKSQITLLGLRGLSTRIIALRTGYSRETIRRVLLQNTRPRSRTEAGDNANPPTAEEDPFPVIYVRCPGCGRRVELPCLACRIQELRRLRQSFKAA